MNNKWFELKSELFDTFDRVIVRPVYRGWIVKDGMTSFYFEDPEHQSFDISGGTSIIEEPFIPPVAEEPEVVEDEIEVVDEDIVEETEEDLIEEPVIEESVVDNTEQTVVVFDDNFQNGFKNHSWAVVSKVSGDAYSGNYSLLVDASAWSALSFRHPTENFSTGEYVGVCFAIKADTGSPNIQFALHREYDTVFRVPLNSLLPAGRITNQYQHVRINFADHNVSLANFNTLLFQGLEGGLISQFKIDDVKLYKREVVVVEEPELPHVDPVPIPTTGGWLRTEGNKILDENNNEWMGKGVNIFCTRSCWSAAWSPPNVAEVKRRIDVAVDEWGSNFLRLCLETDPNAGVQNKGLLESEEYVRDVKEIVEHIGTKPGVYVEVSLWVDPTFSAMGLPTQETNKVLRKLSEMFLSVPYVMYGCVNEPTMNFDQRDNVPRHAAMTAAVRAIREVEDQNGSPHHLVFVQGLAGWGRDLSYYINNPIQSDNVVYETHVYNSPADYNRMVVVPKQTLPVVIGEFGPIDDASFGALMSLADCQTLIDLANTHKVPWLGWAFHHRCPPDMIQDHSNGGAGVGMPIVATTWGNLVKDNLK